MKTVFKATAKSLGGLKVESEARGFKLHMDEPEALGGENTAMNPVEALLCALGSCQVIVCQAFAAAQNFQCEDIHIELEGDLDPDGFMGLADVRNGFSEIRFSIHFKTNESQEKAEEFAEFIEKTCPVGDCLMNGVKLVRSAVVRD